MTDRKKRKRGGASQLCPSCGSTSTVVVTRRDEDGRVLRWRQCRRRGHKWMTREYTHTNA